MQQLSHPNVLPLLGGMIGKEMSRGPLAPLTWFGLLLVWLDRNLWMNRRCSGRQLVEVPQSRTGVPLGSMNSALITLASRRQAPVESESLPEICNPMPDAEGGVLSEGCDGVHESRGAGTRSCASSSQRGGERHLRRKWAIACADISTGGFWTTTPPIAHAGRSLDVSRWKIESPKSEEL